MKKWIYISADYDYNSGDRDVIEELNKWNDDNRYLLNFTDTAQVASGSVSNDSDCRPCDLKEEFNKQINASSAVIFIVGDKTASRTAGNQCPRCGRGAWVGFGCTPYKQNANGSKACKYVSTASAGEDVGNINTYSYLRHEFEQAKKKGKPIIIVYNSLNRQTTWLPSYMDGYKDEAHPFWRKSASGNKTGDYQFIKESLGL